LLQLIERLRTSQTITDIVLCTSRHPDDALLLKKAREWGIHAFAGDELNVLSRMIAVADQSQADVVLRVTGDNPFTDARSIDRMVEHHFATGAEYTRTNHLPLGVTSEVMNRQMLHKLHDLMPDPNQSEYLSFFAFDPKAFHCEVLYPAPELDRPYYSLTIDYPADLELANSLYRRLSGKSPIPDLVDVIALLDADRDYKGLAKNAVIKKPNGASITFEALINELDTLAREAELRKVQREG
jgi:spore coat polysaccharide biosynthesis protein SpsF (cytidylyltransferase family)